MQGRLDCLRQLCTAGLNLNRPLAQGGVTSGMTPLMMVAMSNSPAALRIMLDASPMPDLLVKDHSGKRAHEYAFPRSECRAMLVDAGGGALE